MPSIGRRCYELRVGDEAVTWRIFYRLDPDAVVLAGVFAQKSGRTPKRQIDAAKARLTRYAEVN